MAGGTVSGIVFGMATVRKIHKYQIAECEKGNAKTGFVFCIRATEQIDGGDIEPVTIRGQKKKDKAEAKRNAWATAKAWLTEIGDIKEVKEFFVTKSINQG